MFPFLERSFAGTNAVVQYSGAVLTPKVCTFFTLLPFPPPDIESANDGSVRSNRRRCRRARTCGIPVGLRLKFTLSHLEHDLTVLSDSFRPIQVLVTTTPGPPGSSGRHRNGTWTRWIPMETRPVRADRLNYINSFFGIDNSNRSDHANEPVFRHSAGVHYRIRVV